MLEAAIADLLRSNWRVGIAVIAANYGQAQLLCDTAWQMMLKKKLVSRRGNKRKKIPSAHRSEHLIDVHGRGVLRFLSTESAEFNWNTLTTRGYGQLYIDHFPIETKQHEIRCEIERLEDEIRRLHLFAHKWDARGVLTDLQISECLQALIDMGRTFIHVQSFVDLDGGRAYRGEYQIYSGKVQNPSTFCGVWFSKAPNALETLYSAFGVPRLKFRTEYQNEHLCSWPPAKPLDPTLSASQRQKITGRKI